MVVLTLASMALFTVSNAQQKLRHLSFDAATLQQFPSEWIAYGTAVPLKSKVKITPPLVPEVSGQFFLKDSLETGAWDADFKVMVGNF